MIVWPGLPSSFHSYFHQDHTPSPCYQATMSPVPTGKQYVAVSHQPLQNWHLNHCRLFKGIPKPGIPHQSTPAALQQAAQPLVAHLLPSSTSPTTVDDESEVVGPF